MNKGKSNDIFLKIVKNKRNKVNFYKLIENTQRTNKYVVLIFNV